ncbi:MAG: hypothetical protein V9F00_08295 [Nocardioides sp.]|jgi:hypothetical protein
MGLTRPLVVALHLLALCAACGEAEQPTKARDADAAGAASRSADMASSADPIAFKVGATVYGVGMTIQLTFPEDRQLTQGEVAVNGQSRPAAFWSERFDDVDPLPDPFPVAADESVLAGGTVEPECEDPAAADLPVLTVTSRNLAGATLVNSYKPADPKRYRAALAEWCAMPPSVSVSASKQWPDGRFEVTLQVFNPTSEPVTAKSAGMTIAGTVWESASTEVAPRSRGELTLRGHGDGCSSENPWGTGHVTIDGVVQELEEWESEQC